MPVSKKMTAAAGGASMVRKMFEEGTLLKAKFGPDKVFDFSIGNPDVPPPPIFKETLSAIIAQDRPGIHGYMPNAGWPKVRERVASFLTREQGQYLQNPFTADHVLMTVGAAGALNVIFKSVLDPGDEVIVPRPYFMEYNFYADNHGAKIVPAEPGEDFHLNISDIRSKITTATRVVLINSPHNPTGVVYTLEELSELGQMLSEAGKKIGRPILLVSDEPYRKLVYGGMDVPSVFQAYPYTMIGTSYSKDMSLPGERIGYAAINPDMPDSKPLFDAMSMANRILGFVSAPSLMQLTMGELQGVTVDISYYEQRRDLFVAGLQKIGFELTIPDGAFYLFPKSPIADDSAFVNLLKQENVLTVPGRGFAQPGYFRICYCVPETTIRNSLPGFARAFAKAKTMK
ncbi:pyridoxal phosphate-dependent aminotransferase [Deltaproteobacteria bacterium Smac51]|nr:pyridoxal phosphate-dependent aminotransferase [Deltaproteobacteria bacterium Smac51]